MRTMYNVIGMIMEVFGHKDAAYKLYLEGFRSTNR